MNIVNIISVILIAGSAVFTCWTAIDVYKHGKWIKNNK
jgi:hypothetical protein